MRFRAVLHDPGDKCADRPKQWMSNNRAEIDTAVSKWLEAAISSEASVSIYETAETRIASVMKPKPAEAVK